MAMLWVKTFHIVLIAAWFAGLFYLPRIYVNLAMETDPAAVRRLLLMARKLFRFMTMIAVPALACGLWRVFERGENRRTDKWYRVFNELPVLGMLAAVALVVIKPF
jgi:protoporphyrinogen IX oxidase